MSGIYAYDMNMIVLIFWIQCLTHRDYLHNQKELNSETWTVWINTMCSPKIYSFPKIMTINKSASYLIQRPENHGWIEFSVPPTAIIFITRKNWTVRHDCLKEHNVFYKKYLQLQNNDVHKAASHLIQWPETCIYCIHVDVNMILFSGSSVPPTAIISTTRKNINSETWTVWKNTACYTQLSHLSHPTGHNPRHSTQDNLTGMTCTNLKKKQSKEHGPFLPFHQTILETHNDGYWVFVLEFVLRAVIRPPRLSSQPERIEQWDMDRLNKHSKKYLQPRNHDNPQICIIYYSTTWKSWLNWIQCSAHLDYLHNQKKLNSETWLFETAQCGLHKISSTPEPWYSQSSIISYSMVRKCVYVVYT